MKLQGTRCVRLGPPWRKLFPVGTEASVVWGPDLWQVLRGAGEWLVKTGAGTRGSAVVPVATGAPSVVCWRRSSVLDQVRSKACPRKLVSTDASRHLSVCLAPSPCSMAGLVAAKQNKTEQKMDVAESMLCRAAPSLIQYVPFPGWVASALPCFRRLQRVSSRLGGSKRCRGPV